MCGLFENIGGISMNDFASRLRYLRALKGITQQKLANDISELFNYPINKMSISFYENNKRKPDIELLIILSEYFGCSLDYIVGLSDTAQSTDNTELALKTDILKIMLKILSESDITTSMLLRKVLLDFNKENIGRT